MRPVLIVAPGLGFATRPDFGTRTVSLEILYILRYTRVNNKHIGCTKVTMKRTKSGSDDQPKPYINSLFMKWLSEWKDDAARKELKTQYSYAKVRTNQSFSLRY